MFFHAFGITIQVKSERRVLMLGFVKQFRHRISNDLQTLFFFIILAFSLIMGVMDEVELLELLESLAVFGCIIGASILLFLKKKFVASHTVLFLMLYVNGLGGLIRSLLSYSFNSGGFTTKPEWDMIVAGVISLYLILLILSYLVDSKITFSFQWSNVVTMLLIGLTFIYLRYGFASMLAIGIPALVAYLSGVPFAAMLLLLCQFVGIPFEVLDTALDVGLGGFNVFFYLIRLIGIALLGYFGYQTYLMFIRKR